MKAITCLPQNRHFFGEWDTKEDTGKSMKNALHVQWYGKRRAEVTLNSEKIKPVALAIVELRESEGIR